MAPAKVWRKLLAVPFITCFFVSASAQSVSISPFIYHTPVLTIPSDREIQIGITVEEGIEKIRSASLLWRRPGGEFRTGEMEASLQGLAYTIPATDVKPPYVEYAILIQFADGSLASFPLSDPLVSPQVIAVIQQPPAEPSELNFVILYPREDAVVFEPEVRIAVSVFAPDSVFDPASLEVFLDGEKREAVEVTSTYIFLQILDLPPGRHLILLRSKDYAGHQNLDFQRSFQTSAGGGKGPLATFAWAFTGEGRIEDFGGDAEGILRGDFRARGEFGSLQYSVRSYVTSEEAWDRQPQNRFLFGLEGSHFYLNLGDTYPVFSDLVLSGKRVRGVEAAAYSHGWHLISTFGEINKPIEDRTYRRYLWGIRPYYASFGGTSVGFSFLKAKDELGSVAAATASPQDNLVGGVDLTVPFFSRKLEIALSAAFSLTALDIRGGSVDKDALEDSDVEIPFDPEPWEPLIVINESLTPPDPSKGGSLAWTARMTLHEFGNHVTFNYRHVGPSYYSLGNPYLQNDLAGWNLSDQFSLWQRRVFVNLGVDQQWDNVKKTKTATTTITGGWMTFAIYPQAPAPALTLALNYHQSGNDIAGIDTTSSGGQTIVLDQRRDDSMGTLSTSLVQNFNLFDRRHALTLSVNRSEFTDEIDDRLAGFANLDSRTTNLGSVLRSDLSKNLSIWEDYSYSFSESGAYSYEYHQFGAGLRSRLMNRKLNVSSGVHRREGDGDLSRWQTDLAADWEFYPKHMLRADLTRYFNDTIDDEGIYRIHYFKRF